MGRIYNFGAGPSMMPLPVLEQAQRELLDYKGSGMSMLEISHRNALFEEVNDQAQAHIKLGGDVHGRRGFPTVFHDPYEFPDPWQSGSLCHYQHLF